VEALAKLLGREARGLARKSWPGSPGEGIRLDSAGESYPSINLLSIGPRRGNIGRRFYKKSYIRLLLASTVGPN